MEHSVTNNNDGPNNTPGAEIHVRGRFDAHDAPAFRASMDELLGSGTAHIGVHLTDVTFVDSTALAELVHGMKQARERGGDLTLHQVSDPVRVILELTRLDAAFKLVDQPAPASA